MMKHIRLWGAAVFFGTIALILILWWLLAGLLLERAVEEVGTDLVGAQVELASADVSLFPLSIELLGLAITNPDAPMSNAVEISRIAAGVELRPLFKRKVLIEQLGVEGVRLNTPRTSSGAIGPMVEPEVAVDGDSDDSAALAMPSFDAPNIDEILANEDLESLRLIEEARKTAEDAVKDWKKRITELPDEARLDEYKSQIQKLGKGSISDVLSSAGEIASLRGDVEHDLTALKAATKDIKGETGRIQQLASRAAKAPARDLARLQQKYGLTQQGMGNLSRRLLGPQIGDQIATALEWWARIEPLVARYGGSLEGDASETAQAVETLRGKGMIVRFREDEPTPDFLIRQADVSIELEAGTFSGTINHITPQQPIHGKPLTFAFTGQEMQGLERVLLEGTIDRVRPGNAKDTVVFELEKYSVENVSLSDRDPWRVDLAKGALDLDLEAERTHGQIAATATAAVTRVSLEPRFTAGGGVANSIANTLSEVDHFKLTAEMSGTPDDYELEIQSDIDNLLRKAVTRLASQQAKRLETQLSKGIAERTKGPLAALQGDVSGLGGIESEIAKRTDLAGDVFSTSGDEGSGGDKKKKKKKKRLPGGIKLPF